MLKIKSEVNNIKPQINSALKQSFSAKATLIKLLAGIIACFGLYLIVAWSSFTPLDNAWSTASFQQETINKAGPFGAWIIDILLVFFGHIGNLIPFILFALPLFLLATKSLDKLKGWRFILGLVGGILLLVGLATLATLWFSSYLAGGVIGSIIATKLYFLIGKWGGILVALIGSCLGFIFCSGMDFIRLIIKFYAWLTMKPLSSPIEEQEQAKSNIEELEQIVIPQPEQSVEPVDDSQLIKIEQFINILGLSEEKNNQPLQTDNFTAPKEENNLSTLKPTYLVTEPKEIEQNDLPQVSINQSSFQPQSIELAEENTVPMPRVSLNREESETHSKTFPVDSPEDPFAHLAREFADLEQQKMAEMKQRAKQDNAEDALAVILSQPKQVETTEKTPPQYKPYQGSLTHPAFQHQTSTATKPTTPLPSLDLLDKSPSQNLTITQEEIVATSKRIEHQLNNFKVRATVKDVLVGPVVTRYELELQPGVKASKVTSIDTDLARALKFKSIRIAEVIPGKPYIGIETPNANRQTVSLYEVLNSPEFKQSSSLLAMALGKDISGKPVVVDLAKMPHLLVAGSTGSGKSVGINTMILSLLFRVQPEKVKFIMIDPKVVELSIYNGIPHLLTPVVTDMKKAANALRWCVDEMERRYQLLSALRVRNIEGYNERIDFYEKQGQPIPNPLWRPGDSMDSLPPPLEQLSYIVVVVDEFADLLMVAGKQIEELIARLAQKARAIGIHLILATQRPSVDVITGLIKANIPSRIAFTVTSKIDSRTILDQSGAEALLGRGDMLYSGQGSTDLIRVHGAFMTDDEVSRIADDWRARGKPNYIDSILDNPAEEENAENSYGDDELDDLFDEVMEFVIDTGITSASSIQRKFRVGFNRAARIMDQLEEQGIVSPSQNGKREILARRPNDY